jgi:hypothetical protein
MGREVDVLVFGGVAVCGLFGGPEGGGSMSLCKKVVSVYQTTRCFKQECHNMNTKHRFYVILYLHLLGKCPCRETGTTDFDIGINDSG